MGEPATDGEKLQLASLEERHEALVEVNKRHGATQAREGHPVTTVEITALRLEALIEHLLPGAVERMDFEVVFQATLASALEARGAQVMQAKITAGVVVPGSIPETLRVVGEPPAGR